jgi:acetyl-CoA decarbonylase/synthase complex subunit gamma
MTYIVPAGVYALGEPDRDAPVVVTANYKMSYDLVREALAGRNVWLLVLETYGVNVWCAAGKGTFGTGELVRRVQKTRLADLVGHRNLTVPLLGAAGVRAVEVKQRTGFDVRFATIRCADLPQYLDNGQTATPEMRRLTFTAVERIVLIPVELVMAAKVMVPAAVLVACIGGLAGGWRAEPVLLPAIAYAGAVIAGTSAVPLFLPWLPSRSFSIKGASCGLLWAVLLWLLRGGEWSWHVTLLTFLALPAVAAYHGLNFTGSTPYTSRSGVKKEMRLALPAMAVALGIGIVCWLAGTILGR